MTNDQTSFTKYTKYQLPSLHFTIPAHTVQINWTWIYVNVLHFLTIKHFTIKHFTEAFVLLLELLDLQSVFTFFFNHNMVNLCGNVFHLFIFSLYLFFIFPFFSTSFLRWDQDWCKEDHRVWICHHNNRWCEAPALRVFLLDGWPISKCLMHLQSLQVCLMHLQSNLWWFSLYLSKSQA